jgi:uncharacterized membrane protein
VKRVDQGYIIGAVALFGLTLWSSLANFSLGQWMSKVWDTSKIARETHMSWLALLIVGFIIFAIGLWAPTPPPLPLILRFLGAFLMLLGIVILIVGLVDTADVNNDLDGAPGYSLTL